MNFTKNDKDRHRFRVPTLRNVALTWPYMHDASAATLEQAIRKMIHCQIGKEGTPSTAELLQLKAFLESLTGEFQGKPLQGQPCPEQ
jgi:cytochrome c peroxidase